MENLISTSDYEKLTKEELIEYVKSIEGLLLYASFEDSLIWSLTHRHSNFTFTQEYRRDMIDKSYLRIGENLERKSSLKALDIISKMFPLPKEKYTL